MTDRGGLLKIELTQEFDRNVNLFLPFELSLPNDVSSQYKPQKGIDLRTDFVLFQ